MKQETINLSIRVITPETVGNYLTQVADTDGDRIFSDKIYLSGNDSPSNYREVTQAEREAIELADEEREREKEIEMEMDRMESERNIGEDGLHDLIVE